MKNTKQITHKGKIIFISIALILLMCLQYPIYASAQDVSKSKVGDSYVSGFYRYTIKDDGTAELSFDEENPTQESIVNVPDTIDGYSVTSFRGCFFNEDNLETINFPSSIKEVDGIYCYSGRSLKNINVVDNNPYLKSVNGILYSKDMTKLLAYPNGRDSIDYSVSEGVKVLGPHALYGCSFNSLTLPEGLEYISTRSIGYPQNGKLTIPKSVKIIEDWAIYGYGSVEITLLNPDTEIGTGSLGFNQVGSLKQIVRGYEGSTAEQYVRDNNENFSSEVLNCSFVKITGDSQDKTINTSLNIEWGKDNFSFENSIEDLPLTKKWFSDDYKYEMDYSLFDSLSFSETDKLSMKKLLDPCGGVCFGMSVVTYNNATNQLNIDSLQSGKTTLYSLSSPKESDALALRNLIGIYQGSCASSTYHNAQNEFSSMTTSKQLSSLFNKLINIKNTGRPILLDYAWISDEESHKNNSDNGVSAHAVLAYGIENEYAPYNFEGTDYEYKVWIINPNKSFNYTTGIDEASRYCLYMNKNLTRFYIPTGGIRKDTNDQYALKSSPVLEHLGDATLQLATDENYLLPSTLSDIRSQKTIYSSYQVAELNGNTICGYNGYDSSILSRSFLPCGDAAPMVLNLKADATPKVKVLKDNQTIGYINSDSACYITADKNSKVSFTDSNTTFVNSSGEYNIQVASNNKNNSNFVDNLEINGEGNNTITIKETTNGFDLQADDFKGVEISDGNQTYELNTSNKEIKIIKENGKLKYSVQNTVSKKKNSVKVTYKSKMVKIKKLKKKAQKVKAITVKNAKGKITYKLVKSGITTKIRKLVKIDSKGVITIKKWKKAKIGTYKIKVKITAKGNVNYKAASKTVTVKIKIK